MKLAKFTDLCVELRKLNRGFPSLCGELYRLRCAELAIAPQGSGFCGYGELGYLSLYTTEDLRRVVRATSRGALMSHHHLKPKNTHPTLGVYPAISLPRSRQHWAGSSGWSNTAWEQLYNAVGREIWERASPSTFEERAASWWIVDDQGPFITDSTGVLGFRLAVQAWASVWLVRRYGEDFGIVLGPQVLRAMYDDLERRLFHSGCLVDNVFEIQNRVYDTLDQISVASWRFRR